MIDRDLLAATLAGWELSATPAQFDLFARYVALLRTWNERMNLVSASTLADPTRRHLLDSLVLATVPAEPPASMADVGSGAGLPGLPLAILWPDCAVTLIESIGKKADFLRHVAETLALPNVQVVVGRAEALGHDPAHRERYALVTARAVANLATLAEYCLPLCQVGGGWLAPKGFDVQAEVSDAEHALEVLGGSLDGVYDVAVPDEPTRSLIVVTKIGPTPEKYPRQVGLPAKNPL